MAVWSIIAAVLTAAEILTLTVAFRLLSVAALITAGSAAVVLPRPNR
ncbi:hypothetical protein [Streptomyces cadmiisoli]